MCIAFLYIVGILIILGFTSLLIPLRKFGPRGIWHVTKKGFMKMDRYAESHVQAINSNAAQADADYEKNIKELRRLQGRPEPEEDDGEAEEKKGRVIGGVMTCGAAATALMMAGVLIFIFIEYNVHITQALAPLDDSLLAQISTELSAVVILRAFTGCYQVCL